MVVERNLVRPLQRRGLHEGGTMALISQPQSDVSDFPCEVIRYPPYCVAWPSLSLAKMATDRPAFRCSSDPQNNANFGIASHTVVLKNEGAAACYRGEIASGTGLP